MNQKELRTLRAKSKNWSQEEWERYLQTLEHERSESLISYKHETFIEENPFILERFFSQKTRQMILNGF